MQVNALIFLKEKLLILHNMEKEKAQQFKFDQVTKTFLSLVLQVGLFVLTKNKYIKIKSNSTTWWQLNIKTTKLYEENLIKAESAGKERIMFPSFAFSINSKQVCRNQNQSAESPFSHRAKSHKTFVYIEHNKFGHQIQPVRCSWLSTFYKDE